MRALRHPRGLLLVSGGCFVTLLAAVVLLGVLPADAAARGALLALASPPVVAFMRIATYLGHAWFLLPAMAVLLVVSREARARWWLWTGLMIVALVAEPLKYFVARPRPEALSFGFPSGHSTAAAAFFGALMYLAGSLPPRARVAARAIAPALILLVAMSRVILRKHWPSDVLAGVALGLALACAAALLAERTGRGSGEPREGSPAIKTGSGEPS